MAGNHHAHRQGAGHRAGHGGRYRKTLQLPRTGFPMRADLPQREQEILKRWETLGLYAAMREQATGRPLFLVHDGPPFSNGAVDLDHALNKILKDIVVRVRTMQGYDAPFVPGWDTHGLPTEIEAVRGFSQDRHAIITRELRRRCIRATRKQVNLQRQQFTRLGIGGDWQHPYLTMHPGYEATVLETFASLVERGHVYRGSHPVHWCLACQTALAEAEIEYREQECPSVYVAFAARQVPADLFSDVELARLSAAIWTTAPWTLPAVTAVGVHPEVPYVVVIDMRDREAFSYLVARERLDIFVAAARLSEPHVVCEIPGRALVGCVVRHPFLDRDMPVVAAESITLANGTGLVPLAPGHSREDFRASRVHDLPVIQPVGPSGIYDQQAGPFAGKAVFATQAEMLRQMDKEGTLLAYRTVQRQQPHCWRCRQPVILRAVPQWLLDVARLTDGARRAISDVAWSPAWGQERMATMVADRPDWCLSRQRAWGTPIPVFYCAHCDRPLLSATVIRHVAARIREAGSEYWHDASPVELLPAGTVCTQCGGTEFLKERDVFDVWFDAGCSHLAVLTEREGAPQPADLYLEGQQQFRGWLQASLLTNLGLGRGAAPYRSALTHGGVVAERPEKPSKLLGDLTDPQAIVRRHGADVLRLWAASVDHRTDVPMSEEVFAQVLASYRRLRNTMRFLLGNLQDFTPEQAVPYADMAEVDRWALQQLGACIGRVTEAYAEYAFHRATGAMLAFCAELSAGYLEMAKSWLYTAAADDPARRSTQTALAQTAEALTRLMAPVLSFTAEELWGYLPGGDRPPSVHLAAWPVVEPAWDDAGLAAAWEEILAVRRVVRAAVDVARMRHVIPQPMAAQVTVYSAGETRVLLESLGDALPQVLHVSAASVAPMEDAPGQAYRGSLLGVAVQVGAAPGAPCPRCRRWRQPGGSPQHADLCVDCVTTVAHPVAVGRSAG